MPRNEKTPVERQLDEGRGISWVGGSTNSVAISGAKEYVRALVDAAPELSADQRSKLAVLLQGASAAGREAA